MEKWEKKEKDDAKLFNGKRQKGSGNHWASPGDILTDKWLIEVKQTDKKSYSLNSAILDKIYEEALFKNRLPLISIKIKDIEVVVIFKDDFIKLIEEVIIP